MRISGSAKRWSTRQTYYAKILWSKAMQVLHEDLQIKDFEQPEGIEILEYCTASGQLATPNCTNRETGVYKSSFKPDVCQKHNSMNTTTTVPGGDTTDTTTGEGTNTDGETTTTVAGLPPEGPDPDEPEPASVPVS